MSLSRCGLSLLALCTVWNRTDKNSYGAFVLCSIFSHLSLCCFFFFLNYFCPLLDYQYWILLFYRSLKKNFKQVPFLSDNLLYERILPLKSCKDEQTNARSPFKSFYFESAKNHKYYLVAEESTTALRRQQTQLNLNKQRHTDTWTSFIVVIFY